ncbi:MAG TPA: antitoxin Xre/MbcA/ParS toxin-binding domain-containing protein [Planctomycetaceae bacterium]|nr:antitoxin Xre/MbcA/ParS toxin-binding domain-containing protein [Planctomycetaceae bacterium]
MAVIDRKKTAAKTPSARKSSPKVRSVDAAVKANPVVNLRQRLQLKQAEFARLVPVSVRSLATLEKGTPPTDVVARRLTELQRLTNALSEVIQQESLGAWLRTPNVAFDGLKPLEVIDRGESDRLWIMIYFLRSGVPS